MDMAQELNTNINIIENNDIIKFDKNNYSKFTSGDYPFCSPVYRINNAIYNIEYVFTANIDEALRIQIKNNDSYILDINLSTGILVGHDFRNARTLSHRFYENKLVIGGVIDNSWNSNCEQDMSYDSNTDSYYYASGSKCNVEVDCTFFILYINLSDGNLTSVRSIDKKFTCSYTLTQDCNSVSINTIGMYIKPNAIFIPDEDKYEKAIFDISICINKEIVSNPSIYTALFQYTDSLFPISRLFDCHYMHSNGSTIGILLVCINEEYDHSALIDENNILICEENAVNYGLNIIIDQENTYIFSSEPIDLDSYCFYTVTKNDNSYTLSPTNIYCTAFGDSTLGRFIANLDIHVFKLEFNNNKFISVVDDGKTYMWPLPDNINNFDPREYTIVDDELTQPSHTDIEFGQNVADLWFESNTVSAISKGKYLPTYVYGHVKVK